MAVVIAEQNPGADQEWLYAAYRKLCLRARPLSDNEASRLHGATVNRILRARGKLRHWKSLSAARRRIVSRGSIIREVFRIPGGTTKSTAVGDTLSTSLLVTAAGALGVDQSVGGGGGDDLSGPHS